MARQFQRRPSYQPRRTEHVGNDEWRPSSTAPVRPSSESNDTLGAIDRELAESDRFREQAQDFLERDELEQAEQGHGQDVTTDTDRDELDAQTNDDKGGRTNRDDDEDAVNEIRYSDTDRAPKNRLRGTLSNKKTWIVAGIVSGLVSIAVALVMAIPGFVINNFREVVLNRMSRLQTSQAVRYRRSKLAKVSDLFSADGRRGGKIIAEMEADGYRFHYDPSNRNRIVGVTLPGRNESIPNITGSSALGEHISDYMEVKHPLRTARWKTKRMEAFYSRYKISRSSIVGALDGDMNNPGRQINRALAEEVLDDDFDDRINVDGPADESEEERLARENAAQEIDPDDMTDAQLAAQELRETGEDVDRLQSVDPAFRASIGEIPDGIGENVLDLAEKAAKGSIAGRIGNIAKGFLNPTDILDRVCTVKNRLTMIVAGARHSRAISNMRYTGSFLRASDDIRQGKGNASLVNSLFKRVTQNDRNGQPIGASPGIAYALKGYFNKRKNDNVRSRYSVDGKLTGVFGGIQTATNQIPGTGRTSCGVLQNPAFQIGSAIIVNFGKAAICAFTAGTGCAASQAISDGTRQGVMFTIRQAIRSSIESISARQIRNSLLKTLAAELSFEGAMVLTQLYLQSVLALNSTGQETGATLGSIVTSGGGTLNKQRSLQAGMVPATTDEYEEAERDYIAWRSAEASKQSLFARVFDMNNPDSFVYNSATTLAFSVSGSGNPLVGSMQAIGKLFGNLITLQPFQQFAGSVFGGKAYAAAEGEVSYDEYVTRGDNSGIPLAVDFAGNPQMILRRDIASIDPEENIRHLVATGDIDEDTLEPKSEDFKGHVTNCVEEVDIISKIEFENDESDPKKDCLARNERTVRMKAHLAYLDMLDGLDAELFPEEIAPSSSGSGPINCSSSVGNEKIICAAQNFLGIRYSNRSSRFDQMWGVSTAGALNGGADAENWLRTRVKDGPTDFIDCSGFTNLALFTAFNYKTTAGCSGYYVRDDDGDGYSDADPNLMIVPIDQVQPGDFLTISQNCDGNSPGHIGIFVGVLPNGKWSTLESSAGISPATGEARSGFYEREPGGGSGAHDFKYAARYVGPGSGGSR